MYQDHSVLILNPEAALLQYLLPEQNIVVMYCVYACIHAMICIKPYWAAGSYSLLTVELSAVKQSLSSVNDCGYTLY